MVRKDSDTGDDPVDARQAIVFVPPLTCRSSHTTVVLVLHGAGSNAKAMVEFCGLNSVGQSMGWVMVYPDGSGRTPQARCWNARADCGFAGRKNIDDVLFIKQLVDELTRSFDTPLQLFAVGMSNGGMMSYRLADELPRRFSIRLQAIASVAGVIPSPPLEGPPVSVLHFHGTADAYVPIEGGVGPRNRFRKPMYSAIQSVASWAARNGCVPKVGDAMDATADLPASAAEATTHSETTTYSEAPPRPVRVWMPEHRHGPDGAMRVEHWNYGVGKESTRVEHYRIEGGGHTWPGRPSAMEFLGPTIATLDANAVIRDFFVSCSQSI